MDGQWVIPPISFVIPNDMLMKLKAIPLRKASICDDIRDGKSKGLFDIKSAYNLAFEDDIGDNPFEGKWIWKFNCFPKVQIFLWKCIHNSLPVKAILNHRGIAESPLCLHRPNPENYYPCS